MVKLFYQKYYLGDIPHAFTKKQLRNIMRQNFCNKDFIDMVNNKELIFDGKKYSLANHHPENMDVLLDAAGLLN